MNSFERALKETLVREGGVANIKGDRGGLTVCGVASKMHPNASIWAQIEKNGVGWLEANVKEIEAYAKGAAGAAPSNDVYLFVKDFYFKEFWSALNCDEVTKRSEKIAHKLFDASVNVGVTRGVKFLQEVLNELGAAISVDGKLGAQSLSALDKALNSKLANAEKELLYRYKGKQLDHYASIVEKNPSQAKFWNGWKNRSEA